MVSVRIPVIAPVHGLICKNNRFIKKRLYDVCQNLYNVETITYKKVHTYAEHCISHAS